MLSNLDKILSKILYLFIWFSNISVICDNHLKYISKFPGLSTTLSNPTRWFKGAPICMSCRGIGLTFFSKLLLVIPDALAASALKSLGDNILASKSHFWKAFIISNCIPFAIVYAELGSLPS